MRRVNDGLPPEVLVVCDNKSNPEWIASDLIAQARHDFCTVYIGIKSPIKTKQQKY